MKKLLHIIASPRGEDSRTLKVTKAFLEGFGAKHPDWTVEELDVFRAELPSMTAKRVDGKYLLLGGEDLYGAAREAWQEILAEIERFMSADGYLISTPMWNFNIPYPLKQYIDIIVQPKYLYRYTAAGVEGLVKDRRMVIITSRGGDYSTEEARLMDQQEPYLRTIFGFVGLSDIAFVIAQPTDSGETALQAQRLDQAKRAARQLGEAF